MKGTYSRELVNEAIFTVLTEQFKKDAKEAHAIVEQAGYSISKMDGDWYLKNAETGRRVYMHVARRTYGMSYISGNGNDYGRRGGWRIRVSKKFDFVGYLEKPLNTVWEEMQNWNYNRYEKQASTLKSARWDVKYHTEQIDKIQKEIEEKIAKLQKDLLYHSQEKVKAEIHLREVREELGLCAR